MTKYKPGEKHSCEECGGADGDHDGDCDNDE